MPAVVQAARGVRSLAQSGAPRVARFRSRRGQRHERCGLQTPTRTNSRAPSSPSCPHLVGCATGSSAPPSRWRCASACWRLPGPGRALRPAGRAAGVAPAAGRTLIATNVISPFIVPLKITLLALPGRAAGGALPGLGLRRAGLYSHEKKLVLPLVISSTVLFFIGVAFCYFFVFGQVFKFIQSSRRRASPRRPTSRPTWLRDDHVHRFSAPPSRCRWWWWCWRAWGS